MSIVKTENVIYEYVKRDEEGNVDGVIRAVNDVSLGIRQGILSPLWATTAQASPHWPSI